MKTIRELEIVRSLPPAQTRSADDGAMPEMEIRFSPFNEWYEIDSVWEGKFLERTVPGAFVKTINDNRRNVKVLFDHGFDPQIGNKVLGPIAELREDEDSPVGIVPLFDTSYNRDLLPGLQAGSYGSSFRFQVMRDEWNDKPTRSTSNPKGIPERTVKEVRLMEFGPVTFPANPASTATVRSLTDDYYSTLVAQQPERSAEVQKAFVRAKRAYSPSANDASLGADILSQLDQLMSDESDEPDELALLKQAHDLISQWIGMEVADIGTPEDQAEFLSQPRTPATDAVREQGTSAAADAARSDTSAKGAANPSTVAPAIDHPTGLSPQDRRRVLNPSVFKESEQ